MRARVAGVLLAFIVVALALVGIAGSSAGRTPSFAAAKSYPAGKGPTPVVADLNGDGKPDLVTSNSGADTVSVLLNRGDGTFAPKQDYATAGPGPLVVADLNGDGKPDLVIGNVRGGTVSVLLNRGDGTFAPKHDYTVGGAEPLAVADLNHDGKPDLAIADSGANVSVLFNRGDGTFLPGRDYSTGGTPETLEVADLDGDGTPDLATVSFYEVWVLLNRGDGSFRPPSDYDAPVNDIWQVGIADLNHDGKPDLATVGENTVSVFLNRGDGTFRRPRNYAMGGLLGDLRIADLNGDRKPDLATADSFEASIDVRLNRGDGSFGPSRYYLGAQGPGASLRTLEIEDLNGDGKLDLTTLYQRRSAERLTLSVLLNRGRGRFLPPVDYRIGRNTDSIAIADLNGDHRQDVVSSDGRRSVSVLINTPGLCNVQRVTGSMLAAAKRTLARVNCRVGKVRRVHSKVKAGRVISQKPKFGAVRRGGSKVSLVVSRGRRR